MYAIANDTADISNIGKRSRNCCLIEKLRNTETRYELQNKSPKNPLQHLSITHIFRRDIPQKEQKSNPAFYHGPFKQFLTPPYSCYRIVVYGLQADGNAAQAQNLKYGAHSTHFSENSNTTNGLAMIISKSIVGNVRKAKRVINFRTKDIS